jgi:Protein of unknown function (DUF3106)
MAIVVRSLMELWVKSSNRLFRRNLEFARRLFLLRPALVVGLGFVVLIAQVTDDRPARPQAGPAIASAPNIDERSDAAWAALKPGQQRALAPFKTSWATMSVDQRQRWLRTVDRFQAMSYQAQRRAHLRMEEWARLTPQQRAQARLGFQQATRKLSDKQRDKRWEAYQKLRPEQRPQALVGSSLQPQAPASVKVEPGATTVLMTQLYRSESIDHAIAQPDGDAHAEGAESQRPPPTVDVHEAIGSPAPYATETTLPAPSVDP